MSKLKKKKAKLPMTRRDFMQRASAGTAWASFTILQPKQVQGTSANSRIEIGCIGMGNRGRMLCNMIAKHKGYKIVAVADYFPEVSNRGGDLYSVAANRRYSGLHAYKRLIAGGVDAVFLETPPYCFPEHAEEAVNAGCHVYLAKPLGCDVPGCLKIGAIGERATAGKQVFLVDFQTRTDPFYQEGVKRVKEGAVEKIGLLNPEYTDEPSPDPPLTQTIASRFQDLVWANDDGIGAGYFVNAGIHAIDVDGPAHGNTQAFALTYGISNYTVMRSQFTAVFIDDGSIGRWDSSLGFDESTHIAVGNKADFLTLGFPGHGQTEA